MSRLNTDLSKFFLINAFFRDSNWTNSAWLQTLSQLNLQSISCRGDSCDIYSPPTSHPTHICISTQFNFSRKTLLLIRFRTQPPRSTQLTREKLKNLVRGTHLLISSPLVKASAYLATGGQLVTHWVPRDCAESPMTPFCLWTSGLSLQSLVLHLELRL